MRSYFFLPISLYVVFSILSANSTAQATTPVNLEANLKKAEAYYKVGDYAPAKVLYQQMLAADSTHYQANYRLAEIYTLHGEYSDAIICYKKAIQLNANADMNYLQLGLLYKRTRKYALAKATFKQFQEAHGSKDDVFGKRAETEIQGCNFAEEQAELRPPFVEKALNINANYSDAFPTILDMHQGTKYLLFATSRFQSVNNAPFGLYTAEMKDDTTFNPLSGEVETLVKKKRLHAYSATCTADGLTLYFSGSCRKKKYVYLSNIYESHFDIKTKKWTKPLKVKGLDGKHLYAASSSSKPKIVPAQDMHPSVSADGMTLAFVSDRDGGKGGLDIWMSSKTPAGWASPINMGDMINTPFDEVAPTLSADGRKLYYSSEGKIGLGGQDIFVSERSGGEFGEVKNVGIPINSASDDFGSYWGKNDSLVYFTSNRSGGAGGEDIYSAVTAVYPDITHFTLKGIVASKNTKQRLPFGKVTLYEFGKNGEWIERGQKENSLFDFKLDTDKRYKLVGGSAGFMPNEVIIDKKETRASAFKTKDAQLEKNIYLRTDSTDLYSDYYTAKGDDILMNYKINNIYYDYDKYFIRPDAVVELDKLYDLLVKHPEATILISSHTDTKASPEYNQKLSEMRAGAAVKFLAEKGIELDRMTFVGLGETKPIYSPEKNDYEMQVNRRTEFRITGVNYIRKPKKQEEKELKKTAVKK